MRIDDATTIKPAPEKSKAKPCCKLSENMERLSHKHPDMIKTRCKVCGANHYRLIVKSIRIGVPITPRSA